MGNIVAVMNRDVPDSRQPIREFIRSTTGEP
jgi:hypothetical protein